jgi:RNA polymerase sigma factor (sigma-70 family)
VAVYAGRPGDPEHLGRQFDPVVAAARAGSGWAAERLWRALAPAVAGYLRVQGAAEPEDLTSEVFVGVFRNLGSFRGDEEAFRAWVFTIAHRRLLDERRRAARHPRPVELPSDDGGARAPSGRDGPGTPMAASAEHDALRRLGADRVRALCARLAPDQRDVLVLRLVGGLTIEEVATAIGKTPGAVKSLQHRAVAALRKILDQEGVTL